MQYSKNIPRQATSNTRSSVTATGRSPSPNSSSLAPLNENEVKTAWQAIRYSVRCYLFVISSNQLILFLLLQVKFKIALCYSALREHREALQEVSIFHSPLFSSLLYSWMLLHPGKWKGRIIWIYVGWLGLTCGSFFCMMEDIWCKTWPLCCLQMEGIPSKARTLKMNLMLGKLYRISRNNRAAAVCYKECLRYAMPNYFAS